MITPGASVNVDFISCAVFGGRQVQSKAIARQRQTKTRLEYRLGSFSGANWAAGCHM